MKNHYFIVLIPVVILNHKIMYKSIKKQQAMKTILILSITLIVITALFSSCSMVRLAGSNTPEIKGKNSIASIEKVILQRKEQSITIRTSDTANPVLLFLHGGPGSPLMPYAHVADRKLEEHFTVVHWDQYGAGKSYDKKLNPEEISIDFYLYCTIELIEYLRKRFKQDKIFLLGHSWGSYLGIVTAYNHPELLHAYIGMGQVINMPEAEKISYNFTLGKAREAGKKKAIKDLKCIGLPPYQNHKELLTERKWLSIYKGMIHNCSLIRTVGYSLKSPEYSFRDHMNEIKGRDLLLSILWPDFQTKTVDDKIRSFEVPVYFLEGRHDYCVPSVLVEKFVQKVKAPHKEIIWFEHSAHMMNIEEREKYVDVLTGKILEMANI